MPLLAQSLTNVASALGIAAIIVAGLVVGRDILIPLALSSILAFILSPIVRWLCLRRFPRSLAVSLVIGTIVAVVIAASVMFSAQLLSLTASLTSYKENLLQKVRVVTGGYAGDSVFRRAVQAITTLEQEIKQELQTGTTPSQGQVVVAQGSGAGSGFVQLEALVHPVAQIGLTLLLSLFLLLQYQDLRDRVVRILGTDNVTATTAALSDVGERLSQLFLVQTALNAAFGVAIGIALALIGLPNAVLWGVVAFFMRFVPFVGSFLAALPPIVLAAAVDPGWGMVFATLALFLAGESLMGHIIEPLVLGPRAGLSPLAMVAATAFWTVVWGPIGLILAAPVTLCLIQLGQYVPSLAFLSILLGDEPALTPDYEFYHRLLSDDPVGAAEQIEIALADASPGEVADRVVLPALRLAARDHRIDRLDEHQTANLRQTMDAVLKIVEESLPQRQQADAADRASVVVIVPARGSIDAIAATFVATILEHTSGRKCIALEEASGLMALSSASEVAGTSNFAAILLSTVGGIESRYLPFLVGRAERNYPGTRVLVCAWSDHAAATAATAKASSQTVSCTMLKDAQALLDHQPERDETDRGISKQRAAIQTSPA